MKSEYNEYKTKVNGHVKFLDSLFDSDDVDIIRCNQMINDFNFIHTNYTHSDLSLYVEYLSDILYNTIKINIKINRILRKVKLQIIFSKTV